MKQFMKENKGKYVIVRSNLAGVFAGTLHAIKGTSVMLTDVRKLWFWKSAAAVQELAVNGVSTPLECKFPTPVKSQLIREWIEIIPATDNAKRSIQNVPIWGYSE